MTEPARQLEAYKQQIDRHQEEITRLRSEVESRTQERDALQQDLYNKNFQVGSDVYDAAFASGRAEGKAEVLAQVRAGIEELRGRKSGRLLVTQGEIRATDDSIQRSEVRAVLDGLEPTAGQTPE